ncbi:unnamed protein product [Fraxinus pennsylvanica]|uniref:SOSEKI DIX-like domain-containing protein n=1 Tax=Fraxinus pennsylvanica TaxID=56036 RepID=A0AAD1ZB21_9LAMI|nr:unnamed protein product [Fraxinus pennsylvanica]
MEYSQGGSQVRRLHIVYFLSRNGHIEHPHLIRVHHLSRIGVHLRDVKRWLAELRGKDMPETFAWSYKRRYKTGHVWQDLLDDDLITPISDNEYILKGSEIIPTTFHKEISYAEKQVPMQTKPSLEEDEEKKPIETQTQSETSIDVSTEESTIFGSETSTSTDNSAKLEVYEKNSDTISEQDQSIQMEKKRKNKVQIEIIDRPMASSIKSSSESCYAKGTSHSSRGSQIFRNLITCRALDTNDSAVVMINSKNSEICKGEKLGGSQRMFGTTLNQQPWNTGRKSCDGVMDSKKNSGEFINQRTTRNAYKLVNNPNCSQCGKEFKPEKLHAHMKSCKGIKATSRRSIQLLATT